MEEVRRFIEEFRDKNTDELFLGENGYWFAVILFMRFIKEGSCIMVDNSGNRYGTMIEGIIYDISGDVTNKCKWRKMVEYR